MTGRCQTDGTMLAAADYSTTGQYLCVYISATDQITRQTSSGAACYGILQNAPASGEAAEVAISGIAWGMYGATVTAGQELMCEATSSRLVPATAALFVVAMARADGADGDIVEVEVVKNRLAA